MKLQSQNAATLDEPPLPWGLDNLDSDEVGIWLDDSHAAELKGTKELLHPSASGLSEALLSIASDN
ncbi:hypothetical protein FQN60_013611, partial [Etheostoma spectabile]